MYHLFVNILFILYCTLFVNDLNYKCVVCDDFIINVNIFVCNVLIVVYKNIISNKYNV